MARSILDAVTDPMSRPTTVQALLGAIKRESADRLRATVLILLLLGAGSLGLAAGYLVGLSDVEAAHVEAAGTWFGALIGLGTLIVAARVFLGDRLYQEYQLESARQAELDRARARAAQARHQADLVRTIITYNSGASTGRPGQILVTDLRASATNHIKQPVTEIHYRHVDHAPAWALLTEVLPPDENATTIFVPSARFETKEDHTEIVNGAEFLYTIGGTTWMRQGLRLPQIVRESNKMDSLAAYMDGAGGSPL